MTHPFFASLRSRSALGLVLPLTLLPAACSDNSSPPPPLEGGGGGAPPRPDAGDGDGDGDSATGGGVGDGDGDSATGGEVGDGDGDMPMGPPPEVKLIAPRTNEILSESIDVECEVGESDDPNAAPLDPESVEIELGRGGLVLETKQGIFSSSDGRYRATFPTSMLEAGKYAVTCMASDVSSVPQSSLDETEFYLDRGPSIRAIKPLSEEAVSSALPRTFEFEVTAAPLFDEDDEAAIDGDIILELSGETFVLERKEEGEDVFWIQNLQLDDPKLFNIVPEGEELLSVRASNERGVEGGLNYTILVDSQSPTIEIVSPANEGIIGRTVTFTFVATDDFSGVDWSSLRLEFESNADAPIVRFGDSNGIWTQTGKEAHLVLATDDYGGVRDLTVNATISDTAGNSTEGAATGNYHLDEEPPTLSLDPLPFRLWDGDLCSHSFDPVGPASPNQGEKVAENVRMIRVLGKDRTNPSDGQKYYSHIGDGVELRFGPAGALVIDSDDDSVCDDVSTTASQALNLEGLSPTGDAHWSDGTDDGSDPALVGCDYRSTPVAPPESLCEGESDLSIAIPHNRAHDDVPAIFARSPLRNSDACAGRDIDLTAQFKNYQGWACIAALAEDAVGNRGVSKPLVLCFDNPTVAGVPDCWEEDPEDAPSCTDGCTPIEFTEADRLQEYDF